MAAVSVKWSIIPETTLSLNSKEDDIIEISWILIKQSLEFIRCGNKVSCGCSRTNGILGSSLEKKTSLLSKKNLDNPIKTEFHRQFCYNCRDCITFHHVVHCRTYLFQSQVCDCLFSVSLMYFQKGSFLLDLGRQGGLALPRGFIPP